MFCTVTVLPAFTDEGVKLMFWIVMSALAAEAGLLEVLVLEPLEHATNTSAKRPAMVRARRRRCMLLSTTRPSTRFTC